MCVERRGHLSAWEERRHFANLTAAFCYHFSKEVEVFFYLEALSVVSAKEKE